MAKPFVKLAAICTALLAALLLAGCRPDAPDSRSPETQSFTLNVFAASSLTEAFTELGEAFEAGHPGLAVAFNFASSSQLAQQIREGAQADVFASANLAQMDKVIAAGHVVSGTQRVFARNGLVVALAPDNSAGIAALPDLARPGLRLVLAAPEVPVGQYSLDFLDRAAQDPAFGPAYRQSVLDHVVSYESSVKAVLSKVALGEADAGIVYASDMTGPAVKGVGVIEIPPALNVLADYPVAPLAASAHPEAAQMFVSFLLSESGQAILAQHGLLSVSE